MHLLMQVTVKFPVFGRCCFAHAYRDRSETYRQRNINIKHTVRYGLQPALPSVPVSSSLRASFESSSRRVHCTMYIHG